MNPLPQKVIVDAFVQKFIERKIARKLATSLAKFGDECAEETGYPRNYLDDVASGIERPRLGFAAKCADSLPDWNLAEIVGASRASIERKALTLGFAEEERARIAWDKLASQFLAQSAELDASREENRKLKLIARIVLA